MTNTFRITEIKAEGFRGINSPLAFKFEGRPVFLFGNNGVGKTSLLQAIEWCMFGQLTYLPAEEYRYEDAIVNSFHPAGSAKVELTMKDDDGKTLKLIRTRKKGKSTTKGKNPLTLELDTKMFTGDDAEEELARLFELTPEEYYARTHLHQETIRDLLVGQVADRSAMIDKMLGLYRLRQLIESLPVSTVDREIKDVEDDIEDTNQEKETYEKTLEQAKRELKGLGEELGKAGVPPEKADLVLFGERFTATRRTLVELAELIEYKIREIESPKTVNDAKRIPDIIGRELAQIEDKRTRAYGELQKNLTEIDKLHDEYKKGLDEQAEIKVDLGKLIVEKAAVLEQLKDLGERESDVKKLDAELSGEASIVDRLREERTNIEKKLQEIKDKWGDKQAIGSAIQGLEEKVEKINESIDRKGLSAKLLALGSQYFQTSEDDVCLLCESKISAPIVRASLERRAKEQRDAKAIDELRKEVGKIEEQMGILRNTAQDFDESTGKLERNTREFEEIKKSLSALGLDVSQSTNLDQLESFIKLKQKELANTVLDMGEKIRNAERRRIKLEDIEKKLTAFLSLEKRLQELVGTPSKGNELLGKLDEYMKKVQDKANKIAKLGEKATAIRDAVNLMKSIIDFLTKKADTEKMEKTMLPGVVKKLEAIKSKLKKMQALGTAIHDIHSAAISAQQDFLKATIGTLEKDINRVYSKLGPHPHFERLKLVPEEVRGKYIYRIRALSKDGKDQTFVQTGFSHALQNVTAIALFLAIAGRMPSGFLVFDDPSQSLDPEHRKALADVFAEIGTRQQLFVATHDEEFQEELERRRTKIKAQVIELESWTTRGPKLKSTAS